MRILITFLLLFTLLFTANGQVTTSFRGTLNIYQSSGTAPNYEIRGIFNDTGGKYTSDSVDVGDKIFLLEADNCVELEVISIISSTGGIIRANVRDVDTVLVNQPLANAAILEVTPNSSFPTFVDGISNDLLSCIQTYFAHLVDAAITSSTGDGDGIYGRNDTIPSGRITYADNFQIVDTELGNSRYYINFNPENFSVGIRGDSVALQLSDSGGFFTDYNVSKEGLKYATSGYVTQPQSLADKEYVDSAVASLGSGDALLKDTVYQAAHGFSLPTYGFIPVYNNSGTWTLAQADDTLSLHMAYIVGIPHTDTIIIQELGRLDVPSHGLTVGSYYFLDDDGDISTTGGLHNDYMCDVWDANTLMLKSQRAIYYIEPDTVGYIRDTTEFDGDVSGPYNNLQIKTGVVGSNELASTTVTPATYGSSTNIPQIVIDADGRITSATDIAVSTHDPVTVTDGNTVDFTLSTQNITAEVKPESINASHIDTAAITTSEIQDGTITTTDLAFTVNSGSGTNTYMTYWNGTNSLAGSNQFAFNGTNYLMGGGSYGSGVKLNITGGLSILSNTYMGYGSHQTPTSKLQVTSNSGNYPLGLFGHIGGIMRVKGTSAQSIMGAPNNYQNYPALAAVVGPSTTYDISAIGGTAFDRVGFISVAAPTVTAAANSWGVIGHSSLQETPDVTYTTTVLANSGIAEYILRTDQAADTDLGGSTINYLGLYGATKLSQAWSNGTQNFYAGYFNANGVNGAGTNATNNYGLFVTATGGVNSNWSIYSDEGNHYYEDDAKFGGSAVTPSAKVEIVGNGATSATNALQLKNSSGDNILQVRDDRYAAFGATTGGSIVEMFTDASRKTYFDGFDLLMYNRGSGQNQFGFFGGNGSLASPTDVAAGENLGEIAWYGYYNTADRYANVIRSKVDSVAGSTVWGRLEFNYGSSTPMVTMYGKNNLTQVHGSLGVTSRTGTATSIAGWNSGISTDVSVGYGLNLTSGALEVDTTLIGDGGGETNTASNLGAGAGVYEQKVSLDLQFNSLKSESTSQLTVAEDDANNTIDFTVNTGAVANAAATLTTGDQVYDFVTDQGNIYMKDDTINEDRIVTVAPDYLFKIRATDIYSSSGYLNFGTLNADDRFGFDFYDVNGTSSGRINSYYDIGSTGKNQLTIENVNNTELGRILMTHDGSEEELLILNKNGTDTTLIRMNSTGTTIQDDNTIYVNSPNTQFTGSGFDVLASTSTVFTTPATQFTGTLRFDADGTTALSLAGQDNTNRLTNVSLGYGLDLTSGVLLVDSLEYATQYDLSLVSGTTNLTFSGASSPVTLNSSSGTDVTFTAGSGIGLTATGSNITIANSGDTNAADDITGTVASTQIAYGTGANTVASESAFIWDATNNWLGVGLTPLYPVHVQGSNAGAFAFFIKNSSAGAGAATNFIFENDVSGRQGQIFKAGTGYVTYKNIVANDMGIYNSSSAGHMSFLNDNASGEIKFAAGGSSTSQVVIQADGDVGIGNTSPARRLHVTGEMRVTDLTTDAPTQVVGADADGDFGALALSGMSVVSGTLTASSSTIFTGTADATVANTITETTLMPTGVGTVTLPANYLIAGKTIKIDAWGIWTEDAVPSTLELRAELGGTLLCTTGAQTMVTSEGGEWHMEVIFTCRSTGVSGTIYSQGEVDFMSAFTTSVKHWMRRSATNAIDTTVSNAIDLTATHGAADADNSITTTNITVTVLN